MLLSLKLLPDTKILPIPPLPPSLVGEDVPPPPPSLAGLLFCRRGCYCCLPFLVLFVLRMEELHQDSLDSGLKWDAFHRRAVHDPTEGVREGNEEEHISHAPHELGDDVKVGRKEVKLEPVENLDELSGPKIRLELGETRLHLVQLSSLEKVVPLAEEVVLANVILHHDCLNVGIGLEVELFDVDEDEMLSVILTRDDYANIVGTATESAIRILSQFKKDGLITTKGKRIKIIDKQGLLNQ